MASLIVFLALTLGVTYVSSRVSAGAKNEQMLRRFVEGAKEELTIVPDGQTPPDGDFQGGAPGDGTPPDGTPPDGSFRGGADGRDRPDEPGGRDRDDLFGASTFYTVEFDRDGTVKAVDTGRNDSIGEDELVSAAREAVSSGKETGRTGRFLFAVEERGAGTFVAFIDSSVTDDNLTTLLKNELIIGGVALVLIFFLSLFISSRIIKPLEENDKRQKQFVSDAGHELKTPISVISANTEILTREGDNEWLSNIRYETERMGSLVGDLLRLSRAENADRVTGAVDLSRLVEGEELPFETVAFERGVTIDAKIADGVTVDGDPGQLKQLTAILLDNAIRHGTGDRISLTLEADHRSAVLRVENEGGDIPKEVRDRLFERFYRRDEARADDDSFGLGLAIAKAIVEAHRGTIGVGCRDGKVIFTATIPLFHGKKNNGR